MLENSMSTDSQTIEPVPAKEWPIEEVLQFVGNL